MAMGSVCGNWAVCCDHFVTISKEIESIDPVWFASATMSYSCLLINTFQLETHPQVSCGSIIRYLGMWHIFDSHSFLKMSQLDPWIVWKCLFGEVIFPSFLYWSLIASLWWVFPCDNIWDLLWIRVFHNLDKNTWSLHVPFPMLHSLVFVDVHFVN